MIRDLEAALREAREEITIQRCHYAVSSVAWERSGKILARIDAALSAVSGEASASRLRQCDCCGQMKECTNTRAYGMDTTVCEDCSSRPTSNPAGLSRKSREILNGDAYETASGEASGNTCFQSDNPEKCLLHPACGCVASRSAPSEAPNVADVLRAKTCALNGALDAIIQLRARIAELEALVDIDQMRQLKQQEIDGIRASARAEGIAAMRECAAAIADKISTHPDPTWGQVAFLIANSIRGANP